MRRELNWGPSTLLPINLTTQCPNQLRYRLLMDSQVFILHTLSVLNVDYFRTFLSM